MKNLLIIVIILVGCMSSCQPIFAQKNNNTGIVLSIVDSMELQKNNILLVRFFNYEKDTLLLSNPKSNFILCAFIFDSCPMVHSQVDFNELGFVFDSCRMISCPRPRAHIDDLLDFIKIPPNQFYEIKISIDRNFQFSCCKPDITYDLFFHFNGFVLDTEGFLHPKYYSRSINIPKSSLARINRIRSRHIQKEAIFSNLIKFRL